MISKALPILILIVTGTALLCSLDICFVLYTEAEEEICHVNDEVGGIHTLARCIHCQSLASFDNVCKAI